MEAPVAARSWPLWRLPRWLIGFVIAVVACFLLALAFELARTPLRGHDVELFCALLLFGVISIELTRRYGEDSDYSKDVHGIWHVPVALLLPPAYCMFAPILKLLLVQWRVNRRPLHRRIFTAASQGLSYGTASILFHAVVPRLASPSPGATADWMAWAAVAVACAILQAGLNTTLILMAVKGADRSVSLRSLEFNRDSLYNDLAEQAAGTLLAVLIAATGSWPVAALALPLVVLLQRSLRHAQLTDAARLDAKTGLLNAAAWQREARAELSRSCTDCCAMTLAILDIDHFKQVNDSYGHLTGDDILVALADLLRRQLRECDVVGRFGGEEFTILFPRTGAFAAAAIADRLRGTIAAMAFAGRGSPQPAGEVRITVSVGLTTTSGPGTDLDDLIVTADAALYRAKADGRNKICSLPESPSLREEVRGPGS
jgi:diguanylate cyclase (GGDEF)-like protein